MNRIQQWPQLDEGLPPRMAPRRKPRSSQRRVDHALFVPLHYEPSYAYPLLVWLHGPGENETQLRQVMPRVSMRNYVAVSPRGTQVQGNGKMAGGGFAWHQSSRDVSLAEERVFDCIDLASEKFHVAPSRVFLAGCGSGGTMAFRLSMKHPDRFAGVLSVGGPFPTGDRPLLRLEQARRLPLFVIQGRESRRYPIDRICADLRLLHTAGMSVTLRQYPCGDQLTRQMFSDMDAWIMEQVTGTASQPDDGLGYNPGQLN